MEEETKIEREEERYSMVVEARILKDTRSIAFATEKSLIFGQNLKRIEEILYLGFRMASALSNPVILTPLLRGLAKYPSGYR